jgi:hypothetical protein
VSSRAYLSAPAIQRIGGSNMIEGKWAADNSGVAIRLNGVSLGLSAPGYAPLAPFTIETGFLAGKNTLDFEILDSGCPNGLRVELTATTVTDGAVDSASD